MKFPQGWQRTLAYLHAELGQLAEAVALAELLIKDDAWGGGDYRQLARWQQALGQKAKYEAALVAAYQQLDEYQLRRLLDQARQPWENRRQGDAGHDRPAGVSHSEGPVSKGQPAAALRLYLAVVL